MGHCGLRKPGTHRGKLKPVNGARAPFRTRKFFHGLDQPAQPRGLAISGTPRLRLSAHGPSPSLPACKSPIVGNSGAANSFRSDLARKKIPQM